MKDDGRSRHRQEKHSDSSVVWPLLDKREKKWRLDGKSLRLWSSSEKVSATPTGSLSTAITCREILHGAEMSRSCCCRLVQDPPGMLGSVAMFPEGEIPVVDLHGAVCISILANGEDTWRRSDLSTSICDQCCLWRFISTSIYLGMVCLLVWAF